VRFYQFKFAQSLRNVTRQPCWFTRIEEAFLPIALSKWRKRPYIFRKVEWKNQVRIWVWEFFLLLTFFVSKSKSEQNIHSNKVYRRNKAKVWKVQYKRNHNLTRAELEENWNMPGFNSKRSEVKLKQKLN